MKKLLSVLLALVMLVGICAAEESVLDGAGRTVEEKYEKFIVGYATPVNGNFFSSAWGNNMADADVRSLLHALSPVEWDGEYGAYVINESVVTGIQSSLGAFDNKTFTIALNDDLHYSDGSPITAKDYAFSILLMLSPEGREVGAIGTVTEAIVGSDAYAAGETRVLEGVQIVNDYLIKITVKNEYLPYFYEMSLIDYNPYPISVIAPGCEVVETGNGVMIANIGEDLAAETEEGAEPVEPIFNAELLASTLTDPDTGYMSHPAVTSGPYMLVSYDRETTETVFEINPNYKGDKEGILPTIKTIVFKHVRPEDMVEQLTNGTIDMYSKCADTDMIASGVDLTMNDVVKSYNYPRAGLSFISFACEKPAVSEAAVRKAIAQCFDKASFVADYTGNYGIVADGYFGIGQWMYQLINGSTVPPEEDDPAEWEALNFEGLTLYELDPAAAAEQLAAAGWTLNAAGEEFDPEKDEFRCKFAEDGTLMTLDLKLQLPEGNRAAQLMSEYLVPGCAEAGIRITVEELEFTELLKGYYRQTERGADMYYLATNFAPSYDYYYTFNTADAYSGQVNTTGIVDATLEKLAYDMHSCEPGDALGYCKAWVEFQNYFTDVLPIIPVYSNVFFDFAVPILQNYQINENLSWSDSVYYSYLSDAVPEEEEELAEGEEVLEGEEEFLD